MAAARSTRSRSPSTAASRATWRARGDNAATCSPKSWAPPGSGSGSGSRPANWAGLSSRTISRNASGFPPVSPTNSRTTPAPGTAPSPAPTPAPVPGTTPAPASAPGTAPASAPVVAVVTPVVSRAVAASGGRPPRFSDGTPLTGRSPRTDSSIAIRSVPRRLAANSSASADARSTHWKSSTTQTSPSGTAASASSDSTPAASRNRSPEAAPVSPSAPRTASRCGSGSASISPPAGPPGTPPDSPPAGSVTGRSSWCRVAKARSDSGSTPVARRTRIAPHREAARSSRAVLPTPASPRSTRAPPAPPRARAITSSMAAISADLPKSTMADCIPVKASTSHSSGTNAVRHLTGGVSKRGCGWHRIETHVPQGARHDDQPLLRIAVQLCRGTSRVAVRDRGADARCAKPVRIRPA